MAVRTAIENGAKVDKPDSHGATPLMLAAKFNKSPEVVSILLDAGARLEDSDVNAATALMFAAEHNQNPEVIFALLKAGAKVNNQDREGITALMYAAKDNPNPEIVSVILNAGADAAIRSKEGKTAFDYAKSNASVNETEQYQRLSVARFVSSEGFLELVKNGTPEKIQAAIHAGARVDERDKNGETPLMYAAWFNNSSEALSTLLAAGAKIDERDKNGETPLMYAAWFNENPAVMSKLFEAGAKIDDRNTSGATPLMLAAGHNGNSEVISALLQAGAKIDDRDNESRTPLMYAAWTNPNPEVISVLLKAGANAGDRDASGLTSLQYATQYNKTPEVVSALQEGASERRSKEETKETTPMQQQTGQAASSIRLENVSIDDIYPVFRTYYAAHPLGGAVLHNGLDRSISDIRVTFQIKEFMTDPADCHAPSELGPGQSQSISFYGLFLPNILETTENTKAQARVELDYTLDGQIQHQDLIQDVPILNRNATTWIDDRRAAAFVTTKDPAVLLFSKNVSSMVKGKVKGELDSNLLVAMALFEALQLYGLTYSQDPIPTVTSNNQVADYIQFPRQTLEYKGGKCGDLSVLYSALLESVGVETTLITTPGHIFVAVSLGMSPDDARKIFSLPDDLIMRDEKSWIPVEVTENAGFMQAWQDGAREWRESLSREQAAFYPLHDAWKVYEPVGLSGSEVALSLPPTEKIVESYLQQVGWLVDQELSPKVVALKRQIETASDPRKPRNALGVLYARYGQYDRAKQEFERLIAKEEYTPALLNLGNILYLSEQKEKALDYYDRAYAKDPENPHVLLAVAIVNHDLENYYRVKKVYAELKARDPDLAARFAYLELRGEEATRSADASGLGGTVIWEE
jgi:ankyrin repeat protein/tetratricopeptide (TPR) repeat protein